MYVYLGLKSKYFPSKSRDSTESAVAGYGFGDRGLIPRLGGPSSLLSSVYGGLCPRKLSGMSLNVTTPLHLVSRLRKRGAMSPLLVCLIIRC